MTGQRALLVVLAVMAACTVPSGATAAASGRSVHIPKLQGTFLEMGYVQLHQDGLKVTIGHGFVVDSLSGGGEIVQTTPSAGQRVAAGSTVSLRIGCRECAEGSPAVPTHTPAYSVPDFVSKPLSAVTRWIDPKTLYLTEHFGRLQAATAAQFGENYRVARQHPAPGSTLRLGIGRKLSPTSGSFTPTPLIVFLAQRR